MGTLQALRSKVVQMLLQQIERFKHFDHDFIGVPDTILAGSRVAEQQAAQRLRDLASSKDQGTSPIARLLPRKSTHRKSTAPLSPSLAKSRSKNRGLKTKSGK
jgi:hypothetical protein